MVETVGAKPVGDVAVSRVAAPMPVSRASAAADNRASSSPVDTAQAGGIARSMAASAPVDTDRVQRIKRAIAEGNFPIVPATIADRLIALKLEWSPNDRFQHD